MLIKLLGNLLKGGQYKESKVTFMNGAAHLVKAIALPCRVVLKKVTSCYLFSSSRGGKKK